MIRYSVVVPTLARPCLGACLRALATARGPAPELVVVVDDRPHGGTPIEVPAELTALTEVEIVASGGAGPAAARNTGWRRTRSPWVAFLDDDVRVGPDWRARLAADLTGRPPRVGGVQGRITVPLPPGRRPTDWERGTAGLARARWITADMAYRRDALVESGGFDERFRRAFREDADLALRIMADGWVLETGRRTTAHPVRPASPWASVAAQAGNADDALMRAVHGPGWYRRAGERPGRRPRHLMISAAAVSAAALALAGRRRSSALAAALAVAGTGEFAVARIRPGPGSPREVAVMVVTSLLIPPAAAWHWGRGVWASRGAAPWPGPARAVLVDGDRRSGAGRREAVALLRGRGVRVGDVRTRAAGRGAASATGRIAAGGGSGADPDTARALRQAAAGLGVEPAGCVLLGDGRTDVAGARAAGVRVVLVTTPRRGGPEPAGVRTADGFVEAARLILGDGLRDGLPDGSLPAVWP